ncbi:cell wall protein [Streptomyces bluensis]|uniref:Cell wall protein n=1 Tax=Streptomyces bluensis TaxID=33897 RepID=A0ABW6UG57_9ACTN
MIAAVLTGGTTRHATAASATTSLPADPSRPTCAGTHPGSFPLRSRIHGGPTRYDAGGGYGTWSLELTNTTSRTCENIHPVIVLVDGKRALQPTQPTLEFYDGSDAHPVTFERTDADELVGVLDHEGFSGFTVRPRSTLTVRLRLAVISGAVPDNDVVVNAAVVQRRGDDGDWVGESNDYRFRIVDSDEGSSRRGEESGGREEGGGREEPSGRDEGDTATRKHGDGTARTEGDTPAPKRDTPGRPERPEQGDTTARREGGEGDTGGTSGTAASDERSTVAEELARTGAGVSTYVMTLTFVTGALLFTLGALLVALARRTSR